MLKSVEKEVEKILNLKNKDKIKNKNKYHVIVPLSSIVIYFIFLIFSINEILHFEQIKFYILLFLGFFAINFATMASLLFFSDIANKKNIKNDSGLKLLSENYFVSCKKRKKIKEEFDLLSPIEKSIIKDNSCKNELNYNEILNSIYFSKVISLNIKDFVYYINNEMENDFSLHKFNFSKSEIIEKRLTRLLENDIEEKDFNTYQKDLINVIELIKNKSQQLIFLKKMKKLREKYDEETIVNEINLIKNKVTKYHQEKTNKVLKSI